MSYSFCSGPYPANWEDATELFEKTPFFFAEKAYADLGTRKVAVSINGTTYVFSFYNAKAFAFSCCGGDYCDDYCEAQRAVNFLRQVNWDKLEAEANAKMLADWDKAEAEVALEAKVLADWAAAEAEAEVALEAEAFDVDDPAG